MLIHEQALQLTIWSRLAAILTFAMLSSQAFASPDPSPSDKNSHSESDSALILTATALEFSTSVLSENGRTRDELLLYQLPKGAESNLESAVNSGLAVAADLIESSLEGSPRLVLVAWDESDYWRTGRSIPFAENGAAVFIGLISTERIGERRLSLTRGFKSGTQESTTILITEVAVDEAIALPRSEQRMYFAGLILHELLHVLGVRDSDLPSSLKFTGRDSLPDNPEIVWRSELTRIRIRR